MAKRSTFAKRSSESRAMAVYTAVSMWREMWGSFALSRGGGRTKR